MAFINILIAEWEGLSKLYLLPSFISSGIKLTKLPIPEMNYLASFKNETPHDKTNEIVCAPSEDSDQPGHTPSLFRAIAVRSMVS